MNFEVQKKQGNGIREWRTLRKFKKDDYANSLRNKMCRERILSSLPWLERVAWNGVNQE